MRHYITDQHPDHLGEMWLCSLSDGSAIRKLPGLPAMSFALLADGSPQAVEITMGMAQALVAAGDFEQVLTADAAALTPWEGDVAFVDAPTDDRRQLDAGGGSHRTMPVPHMAQMATGYGHDGAVIVGRVDALSIDGAVVHASGVFDTGTFAIDAARLASQQMLDRVSIDLGAAEVTTEILEYDEDGWPTDWLDHFTSWQIAGLTQVNISAFADARIVVGEVAPADGSSAEEIVASLSGGGSAVQLMGMSAAVATLEIPVAAPGDWFHISEPVMGEPFAFGGIGAEWLVPQNKAGALAMPLYILDDGRVAGNVAYWGQCHVGFPGRCVSPPSGNGAYSRFMVGYHVSAEGESIPTGVLTAGCDHAAKELLAPEALSHYAHNGLGWADVRISNGVYGPWACGVLRPGITPEMVRVLRAGALSGDWRGIDGQLEMIATLAVNTPGFPLAREAITASALPWFDNAAYGSRMVDGETVSLVAANQVTRCVDCAKHAAASLTDEQRFARLEREVRALKAVTQPSLAAAADFYRERISASE